MKLLLIAGALCCALISPVEARHRHATGLDPSCNVTMPCQAPSESTPQARRETRGKYVARQLGFGAAISGRPGDVQTGLKVRPHLLQTNKINDLSPTSSGRRGVLSFEPSSIGRPVRYIAGRLICAVNVGAALAERGIRGTGSALALSYLHWGHSAGGPVPGAVIVSARRGGGHVAIVSRVENGVVYAWNATGGQSGWREIPYRHHVLDYRVPG